MASSSSSSSSSPSPSPSYCEFTTPSISMETTVDVDVMIEKLFIECGGDDGFVSVDEVWNYFQTLTVFDCEQRKLLQLRHQLNKLSLNGSVSFDRFFDTMRACIKQWISKDHIHENDNSNNDEPLPSNENLLQIHKLISTASHIRRLMKSNRSCQQQQQSLCTSLSDDYENQTDVFLNETVTTDTSSFVEPKHSQSLDEKLREEKKTNYELTCINEHLNVMIEKAEQAEFKMRNLLDESLIEQRTSTENHNKMISKLTMDLNHLSDEKIRMVSRIDEERAQRNRIQNELDNLTLSMQNKVNENAKERILQLKTTIDDLQEELLYSRTETELWRTECSRSFLDASRIRDVEKNEAHPFTDVEDTDVEYTDALEDIDGEDNNTPLEEPCNPVIDRRKLRAVLIVLSLIILIAQGILQSNSRQREYISTLPPIW